MIKALLLSLGMLFPEVVFNIQFADIKKLSFNTPQGLTYDIYTNQSPKTPPKKVIMLLHGLAKDGKDDVLLVGLAKAFVRVGYSVFVPDIDGLKHSQVCLDEVNEVRMHLVEMCKIFKDTKTKGVMSFCYSNSPLIAALSTGRELEVGGGK